VLVDIPRPDPGGGILADLRQGLATALAAIQEHLAKEAQEERRVVFVTHGAVAATEGEVPDPASAAIWAMLRCAEAEHPGRLVLVDLDPGTEDADEEAAIVTALAVGEPAVAIRAGTASVPRLGRAAGDTEEPTTPDPARAILITGGTGALGALVARHLVEAHGARRLVLVSRRGPEAEGAAEMREELEALGAEVEVRACDVADRAQVAALVASIPDLGTIVHAAGLVEDALVGSLDAGRIDRVLAPKADAAWHLHEASAGLDLQAFVTFSSTAAVLGNAGQGNYAAANGFLDALAAYRRSQGLPATSIAWGLWENHRGMAGRLQEADLARLRRLGLRGITDEAGTALLDAALAEGSSSAQLVAAPLDLGVLRAQARAGAMPAIFRSLVKVRTTRPGVGEVSLIDRLAALPEDRRGPLVLDLVRGATAAVLGHDSAAAVGPARPFRELGLDSLGAVELRNRLVAATGLRLAATMAFDYPNPAALASHLLGVVTGQEGRPEAKAHALSFGAGPGDATSSTVDASVVGIEEASDEELMSFIEEELGRPTGP
jgi:NADP-dependent 3-hydroxy acid dehydrogenase YdfG/acyl carrier protein